jgi:hypothetical protein
MRSIAQSGNALALVATDPRVNASTAMCSDFDLIGYGDVQQPLAEISVEDFVQPIANAMRSHFLTSMPRSAACADRAAASCSLSAVAGSRRCPG